MSGEPGLTLNRGFGRLHLAHFGYEPIPSFWHCFDIEGGFSIVTKVLPQGKDVLRQSGLFDESIGPDFLQELVLAQRTTTVFDQHQERLVGLRS
jgi:hypothetical protein